MPTNPRSAQAYEKLSTLTDAANHAATLAFDWTKLQRALRALITDLELSEPADSQLLDKLRDFYHFQESERKVCRDAAEKLQTKCVELNERIQNGVYND